VKSTASFSKHNGRTSRSAFSSANFVLKDGRFHPVYRQSFGFLAVTNREYQQQKAASPSKSNLRSGWLPLVDSYRTFFASMTDEIADTITAMQDGMFSSQRV
jgi:hypothetical protein